jgi:hypothetical protein
MFETENSVAVIFGKATSQDFTHVILRLLTRFERPGTLGQLNVRVGNDN